jgi:tuberous sclerosis protein 2
MTDDPDYRPRPRANTASFSAFGWRRPPPPQPSTHMARPTSIHALIEDLTPPAVPSLAYARSLAALLQTTSPCPPLPTLMPILGTLCTEHSPSSLQAAGYDILAAYCGNSETMLTSSSDVLACFDLFNAPWTVDLWESRFKAFANFSNAISYRNLFLSNICATTSGWIKSAFDPILIPNFLPLSETLERQRSLKEYFSFMFVILASSEFLCGVHEEEAAQILSLLGAIAHTAILLPREGPPVSPPEAGSPRDHRRNRSSTSAPVIGSSATRRPADIAVEAYVEFLSIHHKKHSHLDLSSILPLLFRSLAFYASPLPRLSIHQVTEKFSGIERKICTLIDSIFSGPHASSCTIILHRSLSPDTESNQGPLPPVQLSLGAYRILRTLLRRSLLTRLARAYISKANSHTYTHTGAAGSVDIPEDFLSLAWPKEDVSVWEFSRVSQMFCKSLGDWMVWQPEGHSPDPTLFPEAVLLEATGLLTDVLYALDDRVDEDDFDEEEVLEVSKALHRLVPYMRVYR